jgi:hypothetical protein
MGGGLDIVGNTDLRSRQARLMPTARRNVVTDRVIASIDHPYQARTGELLFSRVLFGFLTQLFSEWILFGL